MVKPTQTWDRRTSEFEAAAIKVLKRSKHPMTLTEITDEIVARKLATIRGATPKNSLYALIMRKEIARAKRGEPAIFHKTITGRMVRYSLTNI
jgi:hypothetical protein